MEKLIRNDSFIARNVAGDTVLFRYDNGAISSNFVMVLNETGALLWNALSKPLTAAEMSLLLAGHYHIDAEQAAEDVARFITKSKAEDMLRCVD